MKKKAFIILGIIVGVLLFDQLSKIWVKTHMVLGESIPVFGNWFLISFIENEGMAFGMSFGGEFGKMLLSIVRVVLVTLIAIYLYRLLKVQTPTPTPMGVMVGIALIMAGAVGNIIDSLFYGLIFNNPLGEPATMFPPEGGYAGFLHGHVVDMLYFPIIDTTWPSWVPFVGNKSLVFFRPVFNIADSAISVGVIYLLLFQRKFFIHHQKKEDKA